LVFDPAIFLPNIAKFGPETTGWLVQSKRRMYSPLQRTRDRVEASMTVSLNRYILLGLGLILGSGLFAAAAWLILGYMPLAALGISGVILGVVSLALGRSLPRVLPEVSLMLLEAGFDNIAALVEELGLRAGAIYLPTSLTQGRPRALIPLHRNSIQPVIQKPVEQRLIVQFGPGPDDYGALVATPGSPALSLIETPGIGSSGALEDALSGLLVGRLDVVDAVRVERSGEKIVIEVAHPALPARSHPAYTVLGSPIASIVATVAAESLGQPVSVTSESSYGRWQVIALELQPEVKL
jgi:hypothetical protein